LAGQARNAPCGGLDIIVVGARLIRADDNADERQEPSKAGMQKDKGSYDETSCRRLQFLLSSLAESGASLGNLGRLLEQ
jgi:hypothetical protein